MSTLIETYKLTKWYGPVIGLNEVTWSFEGGIVGLLGPNGAGKSTFLKLVTGQMHPSQGWVKIMGKAPFGHGRLFMDVGYAPETELSFLYLTPLQFLVPLGRMYGYSRKESRKKAIEVLERVQLVNVKDRKMSTFSKGMRQRIKIARALLGSPRILILDEPLNGMDPIGRKLLLTFFQEYTKDGNHHILFSSHVLHEIQSLTHEILLITKGKIRARGSLEEIRNLMDEFPHRIRIQTPSPRKLGEKLANFPFVRGIFFEERGVLVHSHQPEEFFQSLPALVAKEKIEIQELYSEDDNLEAVFRYLVHGRVAT